MDESVDQYGLKQFRHNCNQKQLVYSTALIIIIIE